MAEKTNEIERVYTITLRRSWVEEPRTKRCNRAIKDIKAFVKRHTKAKMVSISKGLNEVIFARSFQKPPGKIKVEVKGNKEKVYVSIPGEGVKKEGLDSKKKETSASEKKERSKKEGGEKENIEKEKRDEENKEEKK